MLIIDKEINLTLQVNYDLAKSSIKLIAYSMTRAKATSSKLFIDTWRSLEMAILRGVQTFVILENWDIKNPQAKEQLAVKAALEKLGAQVRLGKAGLCMHSKTWLFDDKILIIGSHNSTEAGFMQTKNLSLITNSPTAAAQYERYFETQWQTLNPSNLVS